MGRNILVAVAWPYANGSLHVGHLAGAYLPADIFARYHRLKGNNVLMVSGSDAHGTPVALQADAEGITPKEAFEKYHQGFLDSFLKIGLSYDLFTHTETENHYKVSQDLFLRLLQRGYLNRSRQLQLYSETSKRFLPDRYVEGKCPICGFESARGDQCDNCGNLLDAIELINPRSKIDGSSPVVRETEHYFLNLPAFSQQLISYLDSGKDHWRPNVLAFARNFVNKGLKPRPITRDIDWGIPVPLEGWEEKRLYVWFEAVIGYLSASIQWSILRGMPDAWRSWWYNPEAHDYYFIGKDNILFHALIWPAQLMGAKHLYGSESQSLNLPYDVPANEFMNVEGEKFSKSRGTAIWLPDILSRYDPDAIRYYVAAVMPETADSEFNWTDFVRRNNDELVGTWGNLVHRVLTFTTAHFEGRVPAPGNLRPEDNELLTKIAAGFDTVGAAIESCNFRKALQEAMALAKATNQYLNQQAPWHSIRSDRESTATTMFTALRAIDSLKVMFAPFLPFSSENLNSFLGYPTPLFGTSEISTVTENGKRYNVLVYNDPHTSPVWHWNMGNELAGRAFGDPNPLFKKEEGAP